MIKGLTLNIFVFHFLSVADVFREVQQLFLVPLAVERPSSPSHCPNIQTQMLLSMWAVGREGMRCQKY